MSYRDDSRESQIEIRNNNFRYDGDYNQESLSESQNYSPRLSIDRDNIMSYLDIEDVD